MDSQGYLEAALKYAAQKRTISRNSLRVRPQMRGRPIPHYQNPIYNPRNNQINLQVQHRPAIIHPRNMMYANVRAIRGVNGIHYQPHQPYQQTRQPPQQPRQTRMRTQDTARYCNSLGYVLPAPKLIARASKAASNNNQKLGAIRESSASQRQRTSPKVSSKSPSATSATSRRNQKTNNPPSDTPRVLEGKKRVMRLSRLIA
jgi:hypothetical protein